MHQISGAGSAIFARQVLGLGFRIKGLGLASGFVDEGSSDQLGVIPSIVSPNAPTESLM